MVQESQIDCVPSLFLTKVFLGYVRYFSHDILYGGHFTLSTQLIINYHILFTKIDPLKISKINILAGRFSLRFFLFFLDHIKGKLSLWLMV